ncbi:acetyl-CoA carboxylase biotin carboxyl carrier protein [Erwinia sp. SLM-02]|uniref:acetyl-CoA carboxylase biotin carboxyl carrier protein n=1 Tax=Erwinia sp. SLM-02 TaxID=3020057 RepID=UPI00307FEC48
MPTIRELQAITRRLRRSGIDSIEIKGDGYSVRIRCGAEGMPLTGAAFHTPSSALSVPNAQRPSTRTPAIATYPASPQPNLVELDAPMPGRIWLQDPLTGKRIAADGRTVKAGDLLALLQAGPICLPLRAGADGQLDEYAVAQGDRVEYGQPVVRIVKTEAAP